MNLHLDYTPHYKFFDLDYTLEVMRYLKSKDVECYHFRYDQSDKHAILEFLESNGYKVDVNYRHTNTGNMIFFDKDIILKLKLRFK